MRCMRWESKLDPKASYNYANLKTLRLEPGDLQEAMAAFEEKFKTKPAAIGLHEDVSGKVKAAAQELGITVHHPKGILAFEIWMYPEAPRMPKTPDREIASEGRILATTKSAPVSSCQKYGKVSKYLSDGLSPSTALSAQPKALRGRPKLELPVEEIKRLGKQDLGAKAIAGQLKAKGYSVSFRTVHRILTGERQ